MADTWKYPKDLYDVAVNWQGKHVLPVGALSVQSVETIIVHPSLGDVTGSMLSASGVDEFISFAFTQLGEAGIMYTVRHRAHFSNSRSLDKYVTLEIRNPRDQVLPRLFKYPEDVFEIPLPWAGRMPRGAVTLGALAIKAYNALDVDVTGDYLLLEQVVGSYSVAKVTGGVGGETVLLEFAQTFDNGRKFHEYALLEIRVPPA